MSAKLKYILDTSCLTQAYRTYYSFEIAPSFWEFLETKFDEGIITTNDKVFGEIKLGKDALADWLRRSSVKNIVYDTKTDAGVLGHYAHLMDWANSQPQYKQRAKDKFAVYENADPWIMSCALNADLKIVSQEVSAPQSQTSIKIPDVCKAFSVSHIDTFAFLSELGFRM